MAIKTPYVPIRASFLEKEILKRVRKSIDLTSTELQELTDAEVQQLQAIGTTTISAAQWAILGALDQALATTDDVVFNTVNGLDLSSLNSAILGALDQALATTDDVVFNTVNGLDLSSLNSAIFGNITSITDDYTASYYDVLLCDGTFTVTMPDITSDDLGKPVTIINVGTGIITGDGNGDDTFYGEKTIEAKAEDTLSLKPATTSTWRLQ